MSLIRFLGLALMLPLMVHAEPDLNHRIKVSNYGDISYISGGIGIENRRSILQQGDSYNLKLEFAMEGGAFLTDIVVRLHDLKTGKLVLEAESLGPILFAQVPVGSYRITANFMNRVKEGVIRVRPSKMSAAILFWSQDVSEVFFDDSLKTVRLQPAWGSAG